MNVFLSPKIPVHELTVKIPKIDHRAVIKYINFNEIGSLLSTHVASRRLIRFFNSWWGKITFCGIDL